MSKKFQLIILLTLLFIGCGEQYIGKKEIVVKVETNKSLVKENKNIIEDIKQDISLDVIEDDSIPTRSVEELADEERENFVNDRMLKSDKELLDEDQINNIEGDAL